MIAGNSVVQMSGAPNPHLKHVLVFSAAVAALVWPLRRMTAKLWPKNSPTRSPSSSAYHSWETTTGISAQRDGSQWFVNIQPVVPFTLNPDWHVISRTIFPVMLDQNGVFPGAGLQSGLRDTTEGLYFSPSRTWHGFTWGVGPIFLLPTATDELLGAGKWGAGPTWVLVGQGSGWTVGILGNHTWSFAVDANRPDFNQTYPAALHRLHDAASVDVHAPGRRHLRLGDWGVVGTAQLDGRKDCQVREAAS